MGIMKATFFAKGGWQEYELKVRYGNYLLGKITVRNISWKGIMKDTLRRKMADSNISWKGIMKDTLRRKMDDRNIS